MRRRHWIGLSLISVFGICVTLQPVLADEATWKVGVASARITPEEPLWMAGYGARDRPAQGTLHDLWVKVLALEASDGRRAVVLTSDLLGLPKEMYESICAELKRRCDLDRSQVMLTASHTHSGPVLEGALYDIYPLDANQKARIEAYSKRLEKTIVKTIAEALSERIPATLWAGAGTTDFAVNRRNNPQRRVRELRGEGRPLEGPVDHNVPVLAVRGTDETLLAVVFGYACHATTLSFYRWCGDYPGFAQIAMEEDSPGTTAMFHAGCGADQNPLPRRSVALCGKYGFTLADAVQQVLQNPMRRITPRIKTEMEFVELEYEKPLDRADLRADLEKNVYYQRRAKRLLKQLEKGQAFASSYSYPVQAWKLGDKQLWIALGGEVVVDYSLSFKAKHGPETWVTGYANDVMAYIPSRRVWEEGGYEAGAFYVYGLPTDRWAPDIEKQIRATVERLIDKVSNR
ncbi:MAG: neutral/alkaline non-lysosomal ceramidase N-terminal domain-containing protein [Planctomycetota bacterium]